MRNSLSYVIGHTSYADGSQLRWVLIYENQLDPILDFKTSLSF